MVAGAARGGHRGDPRRRLQPHRPRATSWGRRSRCRGIDNAAYYRLVAGRPALLHGLHRLRQHAEHAAPARAAAHHGQPALLGDGDARRRLPLRPRRTLARELYEVDQLGAFFDIIHQDPVLSQVKLIAEPWDVGAGRLPGRQLPGPAGPSGTASTATRVRALLEGRRRPGGRAAPPADRLAATSTSRAAASRTRASTSSPATTASRCTTWSATTTSTTRPTARTTATAHDNNHRWNCGVEGPTDDPDDHRAARAAEAQLPRHAAALAGRADAARPATSSATRSSGNNNTYCQDNELTWLDWELDAAASALLRLHAPADPAAPASSRCCSGGSSSRAGAIRGADVKDLTVVPPRRQRDDRRRTGERRSRVPSACGWPAT